MQRAHEVVRRVAELESPTVVEVGVFKGDMSLELLKRHLGLRLFMVDPWSAETTEEYKATGDYMATLSQTQYDFVMECALMRTEFASDRTMVMRGRSTHVADEFEDSKADCVFIDADHSYSACKADILAWKDKVKPGGWLGGHDYRTDLFGVKDAVDEFLSGSGMSLEKGLNNTWFVRRTW
jgi:hypothetical protein